MNPLFAAAIPAAVSAAGSVVGGLLSRSSSQTQKNSVNLKRLVWEAQEAGFNPLTVLRNGGLSAYTSSTGNVGGPSVQQAIGAGVMSGANTFAQNYNPMAAETERRNQQLIDEQVLTQQMARQAMGRGSIGTTVNSPRSPAVGPLRTQTSAPALQVPAAPGSVQPGLGPRRVPDTSTRTSWTTIDPADVRPGRLAPQHLYKGDREPSDVLPTENLPMFHSIRVGNLTMPWPNPDAFEIGINELGGAAIMVPVAAGIGANIDGWNNSRDFWGAMTPAGIARNAYDASAWTSNLIRRNWPGRPPKDGLSYR